MEQALRIASLLVWSTAFVVFLPGAVKAIRGDHSVIALLSLPACFSAANRIIFSLTLLFAPSLVVVGQITGIMSGAWVAFVGYKVVRHA